MSQKGILGRKLGMTQVFDDAHRVIPVSVIEAGPCRVVQLRTPERDGYSAVQLAFGETKASRLSAVTVGRIMIERTRAAGNIPGPLSVVLKKGTQPSFALSQLAGGRIRGITTKIPQRP